MFRFFRYLVACFKFRKRKAFGLSYREYCKLEKTWNTEQAEKDPALEKFTRKESREYVTTPRTIYKSGEFETRIDKVLNTPLPGNEEVRKLTLTRNNRK